MSYFNRPQIVLFVLSLLLIISLSVNATLVYFDKKETKTQPTKTETQSAQEFICKELSFDEQQRQKYHDLKWSYNSKSQAILDSMHTKRLQMLEQLTVIQPDSTTLYKLSDEIGQLHTQLKKLTIAHFLEVKTLCDSTQCQKLTGIYSKILDIEESNYQFMKCNGKGKGRGCGLK